MKFSEHILIERTIEDVENQLLEEGLKDVTDVIKNYVSTMKSLPSKVKLGSKNVAKELYNAELVSYKKYLEYFPTLSKFMSPLVRDVYTKAKDNQKIDPSVLKYVSLAAVNLVLKCTIEANLSLVKAAHSPRILQSYTGITVGALVGLTDTILNLVDAQSLADLVSLAINVVKSIPKYVRATHIAVEKYVKAKSE